MEINIENLTYQVELVTEWGKTYDLSPSILSLQWEEETNELAQRMTISLVNLPLEGTWLMAIVKIGCILNLYSNWGDGKQHIFVGKVREWTYTSATQKEIQVTAYDSLKYIQQSYDYGYYSSGQSTQSIIGTICGAWGIPFSYLWGDSLVHEKKVFQNQAISEMILELLEEVKDNTGNSYVCHWKDGTLLIHSFGTNEERFSFTPQVTFSTYHKVSIHDLVTKVKIIGSADDDGRSSVEAVVDGDQTFGVIQKIIVRDDNTTLGEATTEAEEYLKKHEKPEEQVIITAPDVPFTRKGDIVSVRAGDLVGDFYVLGVSHNATDREMTLTLEWCEY